MNKKSTRMLLTSFLWTFFLLGSYYTTQADSILSTSLNPIADTYTDINDPNTNFNGGLLDLASSFGAPGNPDVPTKFIFLKFNLAGVGEPINKVRLSLATLSCGGALPVDNLGINIYGTSDDNWTEVDLTASNQPLPSTPALLEMDAGTIVPGISSYYHWTEDIGNGPLSLWLESERLNDGIATLILQIPDGFGIAEAFFEDREGTGFNFGCPEYGNEYPNTPALPGLQLAGLGEPLAIELVGQATRTTTNDSSSLVFLSLAGLLAFFTIAIWYPRR